MRLGRVRHAATCGALLWLSAGCKETGLAWLGIVVLIAPCVPGRLAVRRMAVLAGTALVTFGLYTAVRLLLNYGLPEQFNGMVFRSPLHMAWTGVLHMGEMLKGGLAPSTFDSTLAPYTWAVAGLLLAVVILLGGRRRAGILGVGLLVTLLAALPDAVLTAAGP